MTTKSKIITRQNASYENQDVDPVAPSDEYELFKQLLFVVELIDSRLNLLEELSHLRLNSLEERIKVAEYGR